MTVESELREFILSRCQWTGAPGEFTDDYPLIDGGLVDSMVIFDIALMIESRYGVYVEDEEFLPEHFESVRKIAQLIESKRAG